MYLSYILLLLSHVQLFCDPVDRGLPGSSVHGISQARILEGLPFPSLRDLPDQGIKPASLVLADGFFTIEPPGKPLYPITSYPVVLYPITLLNSLEFKVLRAFLFLFLDSLFST